MFTRTKHDANRLAEQLTKDGISALATHGNKSQSARTHVSTRLKHNTLHVLVATDIAARGIDIDQLPHVVNFDLPNVSEDYIHRIGRTGRGGATGEALSLVCVDEHQLLKDIERLIKRSIPQEVIASFEPDLTQKPEPILRRSQGGGGGGNGGNGGGYGSRSQKPAAAKTSGNGSVPRKPEGSRPAGAALLGGKSRAVKVTAVSMAVRNRANPATCS